jgi:drug/metabolite transporter (DMT)-like permease
MKMGLGFVPPVTLLMEQYAFSVIALSPIFITLRRKVPRDGNTLGKLLFYSLLYLIQMILMRVGLVGESSGMGAVLLYSQPLFVVFLAIPFLKEKVTTSKVMGAVIGFAGVCILFFGRMNSLLLNYTLIMILSAFLWAIETIYYKKFLYQVDPFFAIFIQSLVGALSLAPVCIMTNSFIFPMNTTYILVVLYSSIGSFVIGWSIWLFLLQHEDAIVLSGSSLIVPVLALFIGWQVMGENIGIESVFGSSLTLGGVYLVNFVNRQRNNRNGTVSAPLHPRRETA